MKIKAKLTYAPPCVIREEETILELDLLTGSGIEESLLFEIEIDGQEVGPYIESLPWEN